MRHYEIAGRVGVIPRDEAVFVARLPDGPILRLEGAAAVIWREALSDGEGRIADRVAGAVGADASDVSDDVTAFLATLVEQRLLTVRAGAGY